MAHGITSSDSMAYVGRQPWHNLGVKVEGDAMPSAQALEATGMDWLVEAVPVYTFGGPPTTGVDGHGNGSFDEIPGRQALRRADTGTVLGITGTGYTAVQNSDSFRFFDELVGAGDACYHTVGTLFEGRRIWILAYMGGEYELDNGEQDERYILLDNSHDGSAALRIRHTPVRVVCANTLQQATANGGAAFWARHTSGIMDRVGQARDLLGLNRLHMERFLGQCNEVAAKEFSAGNMDALTRHLLELDPERGLEEQGGMKAAHAESLYDLFWSGQGNKGETRWDAYNAVTEFVDYERGGRALESVGAGDDKAAGRRLDNSWHGEGQKLRGNAWDLLLQTQDVLDATLERALVPVKK